LSTTETFTATKRSLLALSHAMERSLDVVRDNDAPDRAVLLGLFQHVEYFEEERARYAQRALDGTLCIVAFAGSPADLPAGVHVVSLTPDDPLAGVWAVAVVNGTLGTALVADDRRDVSAGEPTLEAGRLFTARWTFTPSAAAAETTSILAALGDRLDPAVRAEAANRLLDAAHAHPSMTEERLTAVAEFLVLSLETASLRSTRLDSQLRRVSDLSERDPLTGLGNRRVLDRYLRRPAAASPLPVVTLLVDIDGLKAINDGDGHLAGDAALMTTATVLREVTRPQDVVVRMGGDEFLVALPGLGIGAGEKVAERIVARMADSHLPHPWSDVALSVSVGVAMAEPNEIPMERLDEALYWVKSHGRSGVRIAAETRPPE
jgi:diguanylate cyclase (GGDEF)-like protein